MDSVSASPTSWVVSATSAWSATGMCSPEWGAFRARAIPTGAANSSVIRTAASASVRTVSKASSATAASRATTGSLVKGVRVSMAFFLYVLLAFCDVYISTYPFYGLRLILSYSQ